MEGDPLDVEGPGADPLVSAVVRVGPDPGEGATGTAVEDPTSVVSEAAAMLGGEAAAVGGSPGSGRLAPADVSVPEQGSAMARVKGYFTRAGFEVHAPVGTTFSIAARRSLFEEFFGERLRVDEEQLLSPVRTADGGDSLPLERLPAEIRNLVEAVSFPPPPQLPGGFG